MKLADLFVEFSVKGLAPVVEAISKIQTSLEGVQKSANAVGSAMTTAFGAATAAVTGFVTAGIALSSAGQILSFQMERLSRTIAGLFRPEIDAVINAIRRLTDWFDSLAEGQKEVIARVAEVVAIMALVGAIVPRVVGALQALTVGFQALSVAITSGLSATGIGALLPLLGAVIGALTLFFTTTESGGKVFKSLMAAMQPIWELLKSIGAILSPIIDLIGSLFQGLGEILKPILEVIGQIAKAITEILAAAFQVVGAILEAIVALLKPVIDLLVSLAKIVLSVVLPPLKFLAWVIEQIAAGIKWLASGIRSLLGLGGEKEPDKKKTSRGAYGPRVGGPESFEAIYNRFQQAALAVGSGKTPAEITNDKLDIMIEEQRGTKQAIGNIKPAVV